jgi:nucleotide-binding universal stress UspA family protein
MAMQANQDVDMYDNILVPLDGSTQAEAILPHMEELAQCTGARVMFLRVVEPIPLNTHPVIEMAVLERREREAKGYLTALQRRFRDKGIHAKSCVARGVVVETILAIADREGTDLIAMASHGRSGLAFVFHGSVAAGVLQRINRPLLIVRSNDR